MSEKYYLYLVAYIIPIPFGPIYGNANYTTDKPVNSFEAVRKLKEEIKGAKNYEADPVIISITLLHKPNVTGPFIKKVEGK